MGSGKLLELIYDKVVSRHKAAVSESCGRITEGHQRSAFNPRLCRGESFDQCYLRDKYATILGQAQRGQ